MLGSQLGVNVWVSWSAPRGQPKVSLDVEASLRSRSPGGQLGRQLEVTRRSAGPLSQQRWVREGGERVFCVGVPYITRFLSGSFFLRPSPSTLPSKMKIETLALQGWKQEMGEKGYECTCPVCGQTHIDRQLLHHSEINKGETSVRAGASIDKVANKKGEGGI